MERRNYFEILGLEFDPPVTNIHVIRKTIETWANNAQGLLANGDGNQRIKDELALRGDMEKVLADAKSRNLEARALKERRVAQLEQLIEIMRTGETGTLEVTQPQIRNVSQKLKLSPDTVSAAYLNKGFLIQKRPKGVNLKDVFIAKTTADKISDHLNKMHGMTFHQFDWTGRVTNLFDLACFFNGGSDSDLPGFRRKKTSELLSIMEDGAIRFAADMSAQGHVLQVLFTTGTSQIFNSEENRKKYSQTLEREKLNGFFSLLKTAPEEFKKDRYFAESCIRSIQKQFPDYNLALALYNAEAGLTQDPYEPLEAFIRVVCGSCHSPAQFRTHEEAERSSCAVCGAKLYIRCPKCGKSAPASADRCACGFQISEMQFFDDYIRAAQFALNELDLDEAQKQYENAFAAHPGHPSLTGLLAQIQQSEQLHTQHLEDLHRLIDQGMLTAAQAELTRIRNAMPKLNLERQRKKITEGLLLAQNRMPPAGASATDRANRCMDILQSVKDFQPAIDMLRTIPPRPPVDLVASVREDEHLSCTLSWKSAGDQGVRYQVVRKRGGLPQRPADGDTLARNLTASEFKDTSLQPGICYGYAVFATRFGASSEPASQEVAHFSELNPASIKAYAKNGVCSFSWALPENCLGVRILRRAGSLVTLPLTSDVKVVAERVQANFDDFSVINGLDYGYRLQCAYAYQNGIKYSNGWASGLLCPDFPPIPIRNVSARVDARTVTVRWSPPDLVQRTVVIREVLDTSLSGIQAQVLPASELNRLFGSGRIFASVPSATGQCQFDIPCNSVLTLAAITVAGSQGIVTEIFKVSSVERCDLDRNKTRVEGNRRLIFLNNQPQHLDRIYYTVAQKKDTRVPWATLDDARKNKMSTVSASDYMRDSMIVVNDPPLTDLYITVIGRYKMPDGSIAYSDPSKLRVNNTPKTQLRYQMAWNPNFFGPRTKNSKLVLRTDALELPRMRLVCRADGHIPMRDGDPENMVLRVINESDWVRQNNEYTCSFDDNFWNNLHRGTELRLMLDAGDLTEYDLIPDKLQTLKVP